MNQDSKNLYNSPWIRFDMKIWQPLICDIKPDWYKKNQFVYEQEQAARYVYIIASGRVRITAFHLDGTEKQFYIAQRGCMIGENSCFMGIENTTFAVAIVESLIYRIPFESLKTAMRDHWDLTLQVIQVTCRKNNALLSQVAELSFAQALQRISQMLLNLAQEYGKNVDGDIKINIKFTHQDVANMTTASRVTVSNVFHALAERNVIEKRDGYFMLLDMKQLEEFSKGRLII